ncbi:hypothetical protein Pla144_24400 [Bythopirellula polymerisocia]|uniref:Uncharacterized protein n=1 Tax=Bythopirellula polymerisocia TaxID=2528003 RepID=A0A5C6CRW2_9BACT|nr:hypothetical protein Pla144_24400 [Bythopirellula polymerisocia]
MTCNPRIYSRRRNLRRNRFVRTHSALVSIPRKQPGSLPTNPLPPEPPDPQDVPAPSPHDVPAPSPFDDPVPEPQDVPPAEPAPPL